MKLGLGTVQFGLDYGISNQGGVTPPAEVAKMLALAAREGVHCLDTAPAYASSEEVLGASLAPEDDFEIVTKTLKGASSVEATLRRSLERLHRPSVYGLLVHDADSLDAPMFAELQRVKDLGLVRKIGVSVYTGAQIDSTLERFRIDLVQAPVSLVDQRLLHGGQLDRLKERGVEIHARSVFLQGLLLMEPASLPAHFAGVRPKLQALRDRFGSMLEASLGWVLSLPQVDRAIVGATTVRELEQLIAAARAPAAIEGASALAWSDENVLNPARWPKR